MTGCVLTDTAPGEVETVAVEGGVAHRVPSPASRSGPAAPATCSPPIWTEMGWLMRGEALAERPPPGATAGVQTALLRTQAAGARDVQLSDRGLKALSRSRRRRRSPGPCTASSR